MLIADGDSHVRQSLCSALLEVDVFSDGAATVPEALARLGGADYGVVVLDVALPGGEPEQIVNGIAAMTSVTRPVVLVLAANPAAARSLDIEVVQIVLRKPVALRQTVELIKSCAENAAERAAMIDRDGDGDGDHATS